MKQRLGEEVIAMRIASEIKDGDVVNVGFGLVSTVSSFIPPDMDITFHSENGVVGYGRVFTAEDDLSLFDYNRVNAGGQFVAALPGMCFMDFAEVMECVWTGRLDLTILGALEVSEKGDLASISTDPKGQFWGGIGGAMDMAFGAKRLIVGMHHTDKNDRPKILKKCSLSLTAPGAVDLIVTDIAVIEVIKEGLVLKEVAPGWTPEEVQALTEPRLIVREVKEMQLRLA